MPTSSTVTLTAADGGSFTGYLATPDGPGPHPGLVVIQEIFGVNQVMRDLCDAWAAKGYLALCPDLFWRQEPGIDITDQSEEEWAKAFELYQGFNEAKGVEDLIAGLEHLKGMDGSTGQVGCVGFCLGGKLAYLMATRSGVHAAVSYYGVGIEKALDEVAAITRPLMLHIAEEDGFVPKEAQAEIKNTVAGYPAVTVHSYPGCDHAFARVGGAHYDAAAASAAAERTTTFLKENVG